MILGSRLTYQTAHSGYLGLLNESRLAYRSHTRDRTSVSCSGRSTRLELVLRDSQSRVHTSNTRTAMWGTFVPRQLFKFQRRTTVDLERIELSTSPCKGDVFPLNYRPVNNYVLQQLLFSGRLRNRTPTLSNVPGVRNRLPATQRNLPTSM